MRLSGCHAAGVKHHELLASPLHNGWTSQSPRCRCPAISPSAPALRRKRHYIKTSAASVDTTVKLTEVQAPLPGTLSEPCTLQDGVQAFFYEGVVFDMDGTLTQAHIDFADMRARVGIPVGDLFTVMESWSEPDRIAAAMQVILDIEADAARRVTLKEGLEPLLELLRDNNVRVALVTRNTQASVQAFLDLIGTEWASVFSLVLTREFPFVKPDKRLLLHVASEWGVDPSNLLMVGDSLEDVEVGNAAGTATCLVAGGGNEKPGAGPAVPPAGAVPTFAVASLTELATQLAKASARRQGARVRAQQRWSLEKTLLQPSAVASMDEADSSLQSILGPPDSPTTVLEGPCPTVVIDDEQGVLGIADLVPDDIESSQYYSLSLEEEEEEEAAPLAGRVRLGWPARMAAGEVLDSEGAPPPGLSFLDWLQTHGALRPGACSFPRMGAAAGGLATCAPQEQGDRVLHVCCGQGGLTKMIASAGMRVVGADVDVAAAQRRGLQAVPLTRPFTQHSLAAARGMVESHQPLYDVVLLCQEEGQAAAFEHWWAAEVLQEMQRLLTPQGRLCAQVNLAPSMGRKPQPINPAAIINSINSTGMTVVAWQLVRPQGNSASRTSEATQLRLVARKQQGASRAD